MSCREFLFLDFETNKRFEFFLMGYRLKGKTHQIVLDSELQGFADHHNLSVENPNEAILGILQIVLNEELQICGFGELEKNLLSRVISESKLVGFEEVIYLNLHRAAKRWKNKFHREKFENLPPVRKSANQFMLKAQKHSLISLSRLAGIEAPSDYAPGKTTSRFNALIKSLKIKNQLYDQLGRSTKAKGTKVLKHNLFDVEALPILYEAIMKDDPDLINSASSKLMD